MHIACHHCDHISQVPVLGPNQVASCPICDGSLASGREENNDVILAFATTAFVLLLCSLPFDFISLHKQGIEQSIGLMDAALIMLKYQYQPLAVLIVLTITLLPAVVLFFAFILNTPLRVLVSHSWQVAMTKVVFFSRDWCMPEIFLVAVLVSLVKIVALADIAIGLSFWAYTGFVVFFLATLLKMNRQHLWDLIAHHSEFKQHPNHKRAIRNGLAACPQCDILTKDTACPRCNTPVEIRDRENVQKTIAWSITSVLLYIPANLLPILTTVLLSTPGDSTIIGGVATLWHAGSYPIAIIIFVASVLVPLAKIAAFSVFCWVVLTRPRFCQLSFTKLYAVAEFLGKWSMVDVFVVAVLAALIQLSSLMEIMPGPGAVFFSLMVITSMIAAHTFDPRLLWDIKQDT